MKPPARWSYGLTLVRQNGKAIRLTNRDAGSFDLASNAAERLARGLPDLAAPALDSGGLRLVSGADGALLWDQYARTADQSIRLRMAIRSRVWYSVENFMD